METIEMYYTNFSDGETVHKLQSFYKTGTTPIVPYEPKMTHQWLITLPEDLDLNKASPYATSRPTIKINREKSILTAEILPITIKFRDFIGPSTTQSLWDLLIGLVNMDYVREDIVESTRQRLDKYKNGFDYILELSDPVGVIIERWNIKGCQILDISFGDLNYDIKKFVECSMVVQPTEVQLLF